MPQEEGTMPNHLWIPAVWKDEGSILATQASGFSGGLRGKKQGLEQGPSRELVFVCVWLYSAQHAIPAIVFQRVLTSAPAFRCKDMEKGGNMVHAEKFTVQEKFPTPSRSNYRSVFQHLHPQTLFPTAPKEAYPL